LKPTSPRLNSREAFLLRGDLADDRALSARPPPRAERRKLIVDLPTPPFPVTTTSRLFE